MQQEVKGRQDQRVLQEALALLDLQEQQVLLAQLVLQVPQEPQEVQVLSDQLALLAQLEQQVQKALRVRLGRLVQLAQLDLLVPREQHQQLLGLLVQQARLERQARLVRQDQQVQLGQAVL